MKTKSIEIRNEMIPIVFINQYLKVRFQDRILTDRIFAYFMRYWILWRIHASGRIKLFLIL